MPRFRTERGGSCVARMIDVSSVLRALLALILPLMVVGSASAQQSDAEGEEAMLTRINELRAEAELSPLARDARLDAAARTHSVDMAWHQMVEHVSPRTGTPADRVSATGLEVSGLAENVSFNHTAAQAQEGLEASAPHEQNMLARGMTHVGISVVYADGGVYATQVFAALSDDAEEEEEEEPEEPEAEEPEEERAVPTMPPPAPVPAPAPPPRPVDQPRAGFPAGAVEPAHRGEQRSPHRRLLGSVFGALVLLPDAAERAAGSAADPRPLGDRWPAGRGAPPSSADAGAARAGRADPASASAAAAPRARLSLARAPLIQASARSSTVPATISVAP